MGKEIESKKWKEDKARLLISDTTNLFGFFQ